MEQRTRAALAGVAIGVIFLLVQLGSLALVEPFQTGGFQTVEDTSDPTNSVLYVLLLFVATGGMLAAIKYDAEWVIRALIVFTSGYISFIVLWMVVPSTVVPLFGVSAVAWAGAAAIVLGLLFYPEWYVLDGAGIVMGAGAAGLFGVNFGVLPALVLLTVLAVYDAISVYGTEHMLTLASGVMDMKLPVVLVVPLSLSYSFLDDDEPDPLSDDEGESVDGSAADEPMATDGASAADGGSGADETELMDIDDESEAAEKSENADDPEAAEPMERDALFIGLGDAVIPTVLVASAAFFAPSTVPTMGVLGITVTLPAAAAMVGTFVGLAILLTMVLRGRAHAGLPLLNGGSIAGYLVGSLLSGLSLVQALGLAPYF